MEQNKSLHFDSTLDKFASVNDRFEMATLRIAYHGKNRNKSSISKATFENAIPSMFNCPIVAHYQYEKKDANGGQGDFGGHDGHIEIRDNGKKVVYVHDTIPIGTVPESANFWWETITENGVTHEYLCTEVLLWKRQQDEYEKLKSVGKFNHSMEIKVKDGAYLEDGTYEIKEFTFDAFCILSNSVEPCFEQSSITLYTLDQDKFKEQFSQMIAELKETMNQGGVGMENTLKTNMNENVGQFAEQGEQIETNKVEEMQENPTVVDETTVEENSNEGDKGDNFALSSEQKKAEIKRNLRTVTYKDCWGCDELMYGYIDYDDQYVYAEDNQNRYLVRLPYTTNGDSITIDFAKPERVKIVFTPLESADAGINFELMSVENANILVKNAIKEKEKTIFQLNTKVTELTAKIETLTKENEELKQFKESEESKKIRAEKDAIFVEYSIGLTEEEMQPVKEKIDEYNLETIKIKLNEIYTKKNFELLKKQMSEKSAEQQTAIKADIPKKDTIHSKSRYAV